MTRRAIQRADEAMVRRVAMRALGGSAAVLFWNGPGAALSGIQVDMGGGHSRVMRDREVEALDAAGIHPGASGWEIEDAAPAVKVGDRFQSKATGNIRTAVERETTGRWRLARITDPADVCWEADVDLLDPEKWTGLKTPDWHAPLEASPARPPLPPGVGWFERGVDSYSLDGPDGKPIARARASTVVPGTGVWQIGDGPWMPVASLPDAKRAAEYACRAAGLFEFIHVRVARVLGVKVERVIVTSDNTSGTIERVEVDGCECGEGVLDTLRAAGFKVRPKVEADPAFPSDGGVEREAPTGAAMALLRLVLRMLRRDETGMSIAAPLFPAELGILDGLCVAFVRELRREVAPAEKPRGIEDAAGAFVGSRVERELKFYKDMSDAAIEEARTANARAEDAERQVTAQRERAKRAEREARELAAAVHQVAAQRDEAREEARVSDLNAVELAADLAKLREGIRDLAARMGAPHG